MIDVGPDGGTATGQIVFNLESNNDIFVDFKKLDIIEESLYDTLVKCHS